MLIDNSNSVPVCGSTRRVVHGTDCNNNHLTRAHSQSSKGNRINSTATQSNTSSQVTSNQRTARPVPNTLPRTHSITTSTVKYEDSAHQCHSWNRQNMDDHSRQPSSQSQVTVDQCPATGSVTVIRRVLQLYELSEYREAALLISRLPYATFRAVVLDLPVDMFVEAIPASLPILDALYAKVFFAGRDLLAFGFKFLHPENVVSHMIRMFAMGNLYSNSKNDESITICKKLLKVILIADPSLRKQLLIKKALIDRAVEGMGHHGLVGTSNDALMNLHEALKLEFERVIQQYKGAISKIDELSLTRNIKDGGPVTRSLSQGPAPTFSSHQRLLSLKQEEIQDRLNKNRSLLCALEPCFRTNHSLQILLAILQKRIDYDKETLFQFGQLRKEYVSSGSATSDNTPFSSPAAVTARNQPNAPFERDSVVAPVLMRFSHGCSQVLNLLKEVQMEQTNTEEDDEVLLTAHCIVPASPSSSTHQGTVPVLPPRVCYPNGTSDLKVPCSDFVRQENCRLKSTGNNVNNNSTTHPTTDDSSDISGYHSDSDMSPVNAQSPLSSHRTGNTDQVPTASVAPATSSGHLTKDRVPMSKVAILTGQPNGTTLLDGDVSVNCGTRLSVCGSKDQCTFSEQNGSICRISIDGKANPEDTDVCLLKCQLAQAQARIEQLETSQSKLQQKLTDQSKHLLAFGVQSKFENLNLDETNRVNTLIRRYERLYSQVRVDVMDALDQFEELKNCNELKTKLLFSIIVLAYRSTEQTLRDIRSSIRSLLRMSNGKKDGSMGNNEWNSDVLSARREVETVIGRYLSTTCSNFDVQHNIEEVCTQIWNTLYDYPCLQKCPALIDFVQQCTQLSWSLHVQQTRFSLDIDTKMFREEWHNRIHTSDHSSDTVKCYVWPTLFQEGICVHKGSVLT